MFLAKTRFLALLGIMMCSHAVVSHAAPISIRFTALIGTGNNVDIADVFNEGYGANLAGQLIAGSVTIDPTGLAPLCSAGGACYGDFGAGAIVVSFTLNGVTSTVISTGTLGYYGGVSSGSLSLNSVADGGDNYLAGGATSQDGMVQQSIGALFNNATTFDASNDPAVAVAGLGVIGDGSGLVKGGITYMNPVEHLDATIVGIEVPEPAAIGLFGMAVILLAAARRAVAG